jgi:hypothetical protein
MSVWTPTRGRLLRQGTVCADCRLILVSHKNGCLSMLMTNALLFLVPASSLSLILFLNFVSFTSQPSPITSKVCFSFAKGDKAIRVLLEMRNQGCMTIVSLPDGGAGSGGMALWPDFSDGRKAGSYEGHAPLVCALTGYLLESMAQGTGLGPALSAPIAARCFPPFWEFLLGPFVGALLEKLLRQMC